MNKIEDLRLMIKVAELYYYNDLTQQQIADEFNISRAKVARYLKECKDSGIVKIQINNPISSSAELEQCIKNRFNLKEIIVIPSLKDYRAEEAKVSIARATANYLERILRPGTVLGVSWGSTLYAVAQALNPTELGDISVVQLMGGTTKAQIQTNSVALEIATKLQGEPYYVPAPAIVENKEVKQILLQEKTIRETLNLGSNADIILTTVGMVGFSSVLYQGGYLTEEDISQLNKLGAVGDICARYFDAEGKVCWDELNERTIGIETNAIKANNHTILTAVGEEKAASIAGALKGGYCNVLITDEFTAGKVLELLNIANSNIPFREVP